MSTKTYLKEKVCAFSEVREYLPGDDVRTIDWNVNRARYNNPLHIKVFQEERELQLFF